MDEDLIDLVHDGVGFLRTEFFDKRRKPLHVAEHDRDFFPFTLDLAPLGKDFICKAFWKIPLDFIQFLPLLIPLQTIPLNASSQFKTQ